jgi:signal transduction histidine kinase
MNHLVRITDDLSPARSRLWGYRAAAGAVGYVALYVVLDWLSYVQPVLKLGITPWNPQAGLTLAFLLVYGPRWAPVTAGAALLSEVLVRESSPALPLVLGVSVWIALGYGLLAVLLRRWRLQEPIRNLAAAARFAVASVGVTLAVAVGYVVLFVAADELPRAHAMESLPRLWIGDLTGIFTLTPLLIYAGQWRNGVRLVRRHGWEVLAQFVALSATLWIIFGLLTDQLRFFYPLFVPVIWIALRWGASGAMLAALAIQIGLIIAAQNESPGATLIDLQFLMVTLSLTALLLGAVVTERADALRTLALREADRSRAEAQLRERDRALARAMRFAVAGELASALAHELNQPITALVSYLRAAEILAAPFSREEERLTTTLGKAAREAIRASEVLRRLRDFYRGGAIKYEDVQVATLCHAVSHAFQERLRRANASILVQVDAPLPTLRAEATQLEIVLHNLVSNAIDAVTHVEPPYRRIELHANCVDNHIIVRVEDSGPGIAAEVAQKLFEPFVTSKTDGMGLGLAISRSLVRAQEGELSFEPSERLQGACFIVRLPIAGPLGELS